MIGEFLADAYLWTRALHIISIIAWMAGLLMLPRYFVYHAQVSADSEAARTFVTMESRLIRIILTPAMILSWIFGLTLAATPGIVTAASGWFHVKLLAALALSVLHGIFVKWAKGFARGENTRNQRFYRKINELPFILAIIIVIMAVVKPF